MTKYIDADRLRAEIVRLKKEKPFHDDPSFLAYLHDLSKIEDFIDSHQQEQPDFPITDEQIKEFLDTHPKIEVPEKYKNPDWLWKKQEQPEVDLNEEIRSMWEKCNPTDEGMGVESTYMHIEAFDTIARYFFNLGLNARKEN